MTDGARQLPPALMVLGTGSHVRSLTKFFGCPALRVGYAVGLPETLRQIARLLPTWPVTLFAANALETAVRDRAYAERSLQENQDASEALAQSLRKLGAGVAPSAANFLLVHLKEQWPDSAATRDQLIRRRRIVVRNCDSYESLEKGRYIRVAVRTASDNALLLEGLGEIWQ
jgi:histidinol-phosphate/aromatic aminotransferase/cobyric acid decarboxylase-like protein